MKSVCLAAAHHPQTSVLITILVIGRNTDAKSTNEAKYAKNAMPVGQCKPGEALDKCTAKHNGWGKLDFKPRQNADWCTKGANVRVDVTCTGAPSSSAASSSTTGACKNGGRKGYIKGAWLKPFLIVFSLATTAMAAKARCCAMPSMGVAKVWCFAMPSMTNWCLTRGR